MPKRPIYSTEEPSWSRFAPCRYWKPSIWWLAVSIISDKSEFMYRSVCKNTILNCMISIPGYPHRMRFKGFNARYRLLAPSGRNRSAEERAVEDTHSILQCIEQKYDLKQQQSEISMTWAFGKRHIFLRKVPRPAQLSCKSPSCSSLINL